MAWQTTQPSLLLRVRDPADYAAWCEFDRRYGELIVRYCHRLGLQSSDAEDVRQIVLMNLSRALRGFEYQPQRGRFRSYLGRVVRNAVTRYRTCPRTARRALQEEDGLDAPAADETDGQWEQEWMHHHLRHAMQVIRRSHDPRALEIFESLLAGTSVAQVAREHDMTTDAVHKVKQRVRDRLKQLIAAQVAEEELSDDLRG
ncbi:MAG: RNA polymerase sigma factor [Planctomycetota bacterium]|jgi:RNA polymerase sigma-70 factor (ECF subfamily)